jgi:hypothetical protein
MCAFHDPSRWNETPEDETIPGRGKNLSGLSAPKIPRGPPAGQIAVVHAAKVLHAVIKTKALAATLLIALLLAGCATPDAVDEPAEARRGGSPAGALLRGEIDTDQYLQALTEANRQARADEQFEFNKEPTRAYNTRTRRFEYVPEDSTQKWNEQTQRWEFTPAE